MIYFQSICSNFTSEERSVRHMLSGWPIKTKQNKKHALRTSASKEDSHDGEQPQCLHKVGAKCHWLSMNSTTISFFSQQWCHTMRIRNMTIFRVQRDQENIVVVKQMPRVKDQNRFDFKCILPIQTKKWTIATNWSLFYFKRNISRLKLPSSQQLPLLLGNITRRLPSTRWWRTDKHLSDMLQ